MNTQRQNSSVAPLKPDSHDHLRGRAPGRSAISAIVAALAICALVPVIGGLRKSLWLDEAWVANSVLSQSLRQMFYYDSWVQMSPPLFLLLGRWMVRALGPANWVFRLVPFLGAIAAAAMWRVVLRHLFSRWQAVFVFALFVLNATVVAFAQQFKQFDTDLAASTALLLALIWYLERSSTARLLLLIATISGGLLLSYTVIFLVPGILAGMILMGISEGRTGKALRWGIPLALLGVVLFGAEYRFLIVPNATNELMDFWPPDAKTQNFVAAAVGASFRGAVRLFDVLRLPVPAPLLARSGWLIGAVGVWLVLSLWACWRRYRAKGSQHRTWVAVLAVCLITCAVSLGADLWKFYPITQRTSLFVLPWLLLLLTAGFEMIPAAVAESMGSRPHAARRIAMSWTAFLICATCAIAIVFVRAHWFTATESWDEDNQAAVRFLKRVAKPGDAVWVHASASEGFKLYAGIEQFRQFGAADGLLAWGDTGWPCCTRRTSTNSGATVSGDMNSKLPARLPAQLWFVYSTRAIEIQRAQDEVRLARLYMDSRGCREARGASFVGVSVLLFQCREDEPSR